MDGPVSLGACQAAKREAQRKPLGSNGSLCFFLSTTPSQEYCGLTKSISHQLRHPGMMFPLQTPANNGFPWFQSVAKWISSISISLVLWPAFRVRNNSNFAVRANARNGRHGSIDGAGVLVGASLQQAPEQKDHIDQIRPFSLPSGNHSSWRTPRRPVP